jgi:hypothetical protein
VGFIREKGKATAREVQWSPEAGSSLLRWRLGFLWTFNSGLGGFFLLAMHFTGFLRWTGIVCTFIGGREQSWEHFAHQPCGRSIRLCISPLGCRNAVYNSLSGCRNAGPHLFRIQEWYCSPWGMGYSLICLRSPDPTEAMIRESAAD